MDVFYVHLQAIRSDALKSYPPDTPAMKKRVHELPTPNARFSTSIPGKILNRQFGVVVIDEAHALRNMTRSFATICRMALLCLLLTATPLHTAPADLYSLACVIGISTVLTEAAHSRHYESLKAITAARKAVTSNDREREAARMARRTVQRDTDGMEIDNLDEQPASIKKLNDLNLGLVQYYSQAFQGRLIRRTGKSKNAEGQPIDNLQGYSERTVFLTLSEHDLHEIHQIEKEEGNA